MATKQPGIEIDIADDDGDVDMNDLPVVALNLTGALVGSPLYTGAMPAISALRTVEPTYHAVSAESMIPSPGVVPPKTFSYSRM